MRQAEEWLVDFGCRLKNEREKQGMTQKALAEKANTKQDYIAQIERGARNPSLKTLMNLLSALDVSADYLIYGTGANEGDNDEMELILRDFKSFMSRRNKADARAYYDIVRFLSLYVE